MRILIISLLIPFFCSCSGKSSQEPSIDWRKDLLVFKHEGWRNVETLGSPGAAVTEAFATSGSAQTVTGFWVENGQGHSKAFASSNQDICIVSFQKTDGDSFIVILSKNKAD
jgi:hypothetical protein